MERHIDEIARAIIAAYEARPDGGRFLVGVAGVPASGKSTFAYPLADRINNLLHTSSQAQGYTKVQVDAKLRLVHPHYEVDKAPMGIAACIGMDGWHHSRAELEEFPDPAEARRRRGAAFTFNAQSFTDFVLSLKKTGSLAASSKIPFPTFSHALKDPTPSLEPLEGHHRIVIIEGLYTFLDVQPWRRAAEVLDLRVFIDVDPRTARERLVRRCLAEGIEDTLEKAVERADKSDMINGEYVREHLYPPYITIMSVDDPTFA
ncbi:hypothetical protein FFLO_06844 [Filobasidium floriforme]|uniref:Phosphoribulokinase/uridine kinase domain-containing protein n=1 Tax=Filobasidium floriforme TaxID=5210 RepID=A0A8K0NMG5_9TREE|nr:P-loop containing nucleoside triphosphate hydrolase protein [Filobasidium floriforme]KAG7527529.1 hypothetical protein FFLO_06844 [Filobasidium floriforme]KAH8087116.1 P-loop containing nucleoside triphosphate hydrolase protein [Filobasidium floriforme]